MNILTKKEIAEKMKVSLGTIDNYVRMGLLIPLEDPRGKNHGTPVRFSEDEVQNFFSRKTESCNKIKQPEEKA